MYGVSLVKEGMPVRSPGVTWSCRCTLGAVLTHLPRSSDRDPGFSGPAEHPVIRTCLSNCAGSEMSPTHSYMLYINEHCRNMRQPEWPCSVGPQTQIPGRGDESRWELSTRADDTLATRDGKQRILPAFVQERSRCLLPCLERKERNLCSFEMGGKGPWVLTLIFWNVNKISLEVRKSPVSGFFMTLRCFQSLGFIPLGM